MLFVTRTEDEEVVMRMPPTAEPTEIVVKATRIGRGKVRLGIVAPAYVEVDRREVRESKDRDAKALENARSTRRGMA
jgi:sRNA-binding carbon storage regulator CsrA